MPSEFFFKLIIIDIILFILHFNFFLFSYLRFLLNLKWISHILTVQIYLMKK